MAKWNIGTKNGIWKGGRTVASNGYVLVRVGVEHPLADVRGYAYEHRLVAQEKIGRPLRQGEQVHHIDGNKQNNDPSNILVMENHSTHAAAHRHAGSAKRLPNQENPLIACACGCGEKMQQYDSKNRERKFISGHNRRGR